MIALNVSSLSYKIGAATILEGVSFSLDAGDRLGVVGANGALTGYAGGLMRKRALLQLERGE